MSLTSMVRDLSACPLTTTAVEQNKALSARWLSNATGKPVVIALMKMHFTGLCVNTGLRRAFGFPLEIRPGKGPHIHPLMCP